MKEPKKDELIEYLKSTKLHQKYMNDIESNL